MKYKLIIEGTKDEIEQQSHIIYHLYYSSVLTPIEQVPVGELPLATEFKVVEPKYRVKTLVELVQEFTCEVKIEEWGIGVVIVINGNTCLASNLGSKCTLVNYSDKWRRIFLKEAE